MRCDVLGVVGLSPGQTIATCQRNISQPGIGGRNMLRAFGHPVATCCDVLGVVGSNLTIFKPEPTTLNMSQHIATRCPNARNMLRPTMLRYVALACCDRLARALNLAIFKLKPATPNTSQHSGQTHATCCAQQCCEMLRWHVAIV